MKRHQIAYIDENQDDITRFQSRVHETLDVIPFVPKSNLDEFVEELLNSGAEAFVVDFRLNEYKANAQESITYTGVDLIERILQIRKGFPCFILTSYDSDAVQNIEDVNYVYPKDILAPDKQPGEVTLAEKIRIQISHYQVKIQQSSARFQELLEKSNSQDLAEDEEEELLRLDSFLESALGDHMALPSEKKTMLAVGKLDELLASTRDLLEILKESKNK